MKNCIGNASNKSNSFWWQCHVKNIDFWVGFSHANGETLVKKCECSNQSPTRLHRWKNKRKVTKLSMKANVWNMPVNPKGGLNQAASLCKVSAVVSQRSAEPVETFGHYKHGCGTLTSLLAWFDSLWLFCLFVSKNKITVMMAPLPVLKFQEQSLIILHDSKKPVQWQQKYTGCFKTLGHNCRRWFPRSLWWKKFI